MSCVFVSIDFVVYETVLLFCVSHSVFSCCLAGCTDIGVVIGCNIFLFFFSNNFCCYCCCNFVPYSFWHDCCFDIAAQPTLKAYKQARARDPLRLQVQRCFDSLYFNCFELLLLSKSVAYSFILEENKNQLNETYTNKNKWTKVCHLYVCIYMRKIKWLFAKPSEDIKWYCSDLPSAVAVARLCAQ